MTELDEAVGVDPVERYTYVFDQNSEALDHVFISSALSKREKAVQHIHVRLETRCSGYEPQADCGFLG